MKKQNCLIFCNCGAGIIGEQKQNQLAENFQKLEVDVFELHDICSISLNESNILNELDQNYHKKYIVACYPRAVENIFRQNGVEMSNFEVLNFREYPVEKIVDLLENQLEYSKEGSSYEIKKSSLELPPWYPVIDKSLCTLCGQCARFCVFGVYKFNKKSLEVINPLSCKNNCPACGRTCPASAIIFPRLPENSALSGAEPEKTTKGAAPANDGLFVMLNERNNNRRNIFRQGVVQQAQEEKRRAIEEFKNLQKKKDA